MHTRLDHQTFVPSCEKKSPHTHPPQTSSLVSCVLSLPVLCLLRSRPVFCLRRRRRYCVANFVSNPRFRVVFNVDEKIHPATPRNTTFNPQAQKKCGQLKV